MTSTGQVTIADLFCGAGGTSTGAIQAIEQLGLKARLTAVNHWDRAVATHSANHPEARHLCASIDSLNPRHLFKEGELNILWGSPECTHHSRARGGRPMSDQSRATAWCVTRWAEALLPNVVMVENVPEFQEWGPIGKRGKPLYGRKGETFRAWINTLRSLGYEVGSRVLCAADYGDPTTRQRLFVQAVRGKRKIVWPDPTHTAGSDPLGRPRWRGAKEIIDWSLTGQSIYNRKRPLKPKTLARIFDGLRKYGLKPQLICMEHGGSVRNVEDPTPTITTARGGAFGIARPFLIPTAHASERSSRPVESPLPTVCGNRGDVALIEPFIISAGGPECGARSVELPMGTVLTREHRALVEPFIVGLRGTNERQVAASGRSIDEPLGTVSAGGIHHCLVEPYILSYYGARRPTDQRASSLQSPLPTVTTENRHALVEPFLVEYYGASNSRKISDPLATVTGRDRFGLAEPDLVEIDGHRYRLDIRFRMLQPHELAGAQGFPANYKFTGNKTEQVKQIGNAVPCGLARALVLAQMSQ